MDQGKHQFSGGGDGPQERRSSITGDRLKPAPSYTEPVTFKYEIQAHTSRIQKLTQAFQVYRLMVLTLICVLAGLVIGLLCRPYARGWSERQFMYIELPGELYLRFLKLMIMPLLVSNVILSFGTIQGKLSSHLGKISTFLYLGSNAMAITGAILLALLISPGSRLHKRQLPPDLEAPPRLGDPSWPTDQQLREYQESLKRYREYHPMSYHVVLTDAPGHGEKSRLFLKMTSSLDGNSSSSDCSTTTTTIIEERRDPTRLVLLPPGPELGAEEQVLDDELREEEEEEKQPQEEREEPERQELHLEEGEKDEEKPQQLYSGNAAVSAKLPVDVLLDVLRNLVPDSIVGATMQQVRTRLFAPRELKPGPNGTCDPPPSRWLVGHEMVDQPNIVGLLAISILIGVILSHMDLEASRPMLDLCSCVSELSLRVGMLAIHLTPFCIMFLLIGQVARSRSLNFIASELCMYSMCVVVALLLHGLILLPLAYYLLTKRSPVCFLVHMLEALVAAFAAITGAILLALLISPGSRLHKRQLPPDLEAPPRLGDPSWPTDQQLREYQESLKRYREYHPMSYHVVLTDAPGHGEKSRLFLKMTSSLDGNSSSSDCSTTTTTIIEERRDPTRLVLLPPGPELGAEEQVLDDELREEEEEEKQPQEEREEPERQELHLEEGEKDEEKPQQLYSGNAAVSAKLPVDVLLDVLRNLVPDSIVGATMQQVRTRLFAPRELKPGPNGTCDPPPSRWLVGHEMVDQPNIVGLLAISILIGVILSHMDLEASRPMLDLCSCVSELSLRVGMLAIHLTPFCIMFLLIGQVARSRSLNFIASELCMYSMCVVVALLLHGLILLPLAYYLLTKRSPVCFLVHMLEALVAAFATSSSSATLALVLNCLTDAGLNPVIVRAFGPLGSVFNMNGTAIYEAIGAIFIAQTLGIQLPLMSLLLIGFSSAVASLSTTGIPSSGMMTMVIVLDAVNLPVLQLSLIYIVDFIIDRFRTVINVWSGAIVCALIDHNCPEHLFEEDVNCPEKYREILQRMRGSRGTLGGRRSSALETGSISNKPQVISVTITPPADSSSRV